MTTEPPAKEKQQPRKKRISPLSIIFLPILPLRLMCRWMYRDPNIRGELLGAVIVAGLVAISAVTGFLFGSSEDRRLDKELRIQTLTARYQTQLDALKAFSDGIPKNITYVTRQKDAALRANVGAAAAQDTRERPELLELEQSLTREWLQTVDHYTSVCRGVRASFATEEVIQAVTKCELALDTLRGIDANPELLRTRAVTLRSLLDDVSMDDARRSELEANLTIMEESIEQSMEFPPRPVPGLSTTGMSDEQANLTNQRARLFLASQFGYSVAAVIAQHYYGTSLDAMTEELRAFDESLRGDDPSLAGDIRALINPLDG